MLLIPNYRYIFTVSHSYVFSYFRGASICESIKFFCLVVLKGQIKPESYRPARHHKLTLLISSLFSYFFILILITVHHKYQRYTAASLPTTFLTASYMYTTYVQYTTSKNNRIHGYLQGVVSYKA